MASTLLRILKKTHNVTITTGPILTRTCHSHTVTANDNLLSRISPLGTDTSLAPVIDKWVQEGNQLKERDLQRIIRHLRSNKRFSQALEVSEWMRDSDLHFTVTDRSVLLDMIRRVQGREAAETYHKSFCYFNSLK